MALPCPANYKQQPAKMLSLLNTCACILFFSCRLFKLEACSFPQFLMILLSSCENDQKKFATFWCTCRTDFHVLQIVSVAYNLFTSDAFIHYNIALCDLLMNYGIAVQGSKTKTSEACIGAFSLCKSYKKAQLLRVGYESRYGGVWHGKQGSSTAASTCRL